MKNLALLLGSFVLALGASINGYTYYEGSRNLIAAQSQITTLRQELSSLRSYVAAPQGSGPPLLVSTTHSVTDTVVRVGAVIVRIDVTAPGVLSSGSGSIIDRRGYVLTNHHVVEGATAIKITMEDGQVFSGSVVKSDHDLDIALVRIASDRTDFPRIEIGTPSDTIVGEDVLAVGFPLGIDFPGPATVTKGIVSAVRNMQGHRWVQTDAAINPGNSGGALVTLEGKMIGIPSMGIEQAHEDIEMIGMAIPIDVAMTYVQDVLNRPSMP